MIVPVNVHSSQFPEQLQQELLESFRSRKINHKFHYETRGQAQRWLRVHDKYSPSRTDDETKQQFVEVFAAASKFVEKPAVHIIGLGCGGGTKDIMLVEHLRRLGKMIVYSACDSSVPLVLTAQQKALAILDERHVHDLVADFVAAEDLKRTFITQTTGNSTRIINFLGMIPNFEPADILARISTLLRPNDILIFSANLAPGDDYRAGVEKVLPQYDNEETRHWLMSVLNDQGIDFIDGDLKFEVEEVEANGLIRVVAKFHFNVDKTITIDDEEFPFAADDTIQVFFSYRHTPETVRTWLGKESIEVVDERITAGGEEGIFICRKNAHDPKG
ncbi:MAG: L-histidine N(alpha)-methyltransferase [Limisphaerales bacterium]